MGANGEHTTMYYTTSDRPSRPLARPQPHRRDTKPNFNQKRDGESGNSRYLPMKPSVPVPNVVSSTKRNPAPSISQLFPIDTSEIHSINVMWAKQGRSKRGLELISGELVGFKKQHEDMTNPKSTMSFASTSAATSAFVSMSPSTSATSTSCSSLPSALFSSFAPSSTSTASIATVVCKSSPCPGLSKCAERCCGPMPQAHPKMESGPIVQSPSGPPSKSRSLSLSSTQPRASVSPSDSPLHVLLDQARKDGVCSAELAIRESSPKTKARMHIRRRLHPLSRMEGNLRRHITSSSSSSPASHNLFRAALVENFVSSLTNKLPTSYFQGNDGDDGGDAFPLLPLHHQKTPHPEPYTRHFPPLLPQPRSPFRSRSPPRHPTPRFRLIENREYLRLKAVWNRLSDLEVFADTDGVYYDADSTSGIRLRELDCGCEDECDHGCECENEEIGSSGSGRCPAHRDDTSSHRHRLPLPSSSLVDKQGSLHTGCELVVGIAIDGIKESTLGYRNTMKRHAAADSSMIDLLDGLSLTNLLSSSKISSFSSSLRRTLDSFRHLGEIHASLGSGAYCDNGPTVKTPRRAHAHVAVIHSNRSISVSGPEGL